jgi:hypothetical protein
MPSTHKKVVVRKLDRDTINGYVGAQFVADGKLEMLNTSGNVVSIPLRDVKAVYFVREFSEVDAMARKTFTTRPRTAGLWVRLKFRDSETLEGLMANDLLQAPSDGYLLSPPDPRANTQRIFVPRTALASLTVLGVIGESSARRRAAAVTDARQVRLFSDQ